MVDVHDAPRWRIVARSHLSSSIFRFPNPFVHFRDLLWDRVLEGAETHFSRHNAGWSAVTTHPACAGRAPAAWAAGCARASRMAVRALRPLRRPVSTIEQRAA